MSIRIIVLLLALVPVALSSCASHPPARKRAPIEVAQAPVEAQDDALDSPPATAPNESASEMGLIPAPSFFPASGPKTKYQTISESFDSAPFPAELTDFDSLDEPSPMTSCFSVKAIEPSTMSEFVIKQMMVQLEGNPDYGPLFPGSTDRVEPRLVIGKNNGWVNSQNLTNEKRQVFELGRMANSLLIRINENKFGIYQDVGAPAEVWIRKNKNGLIFFKVYKVDLERKRTEVFIGYCFRR